MDRIIKAVIFGGKARVTAIDDTEAVRQSIINHGLSPLATAVLGRTLTIGAYISTNLKDNNAKFSVTIDGGGSIGKVVVAGEGGNKIKGYVENPLVDLPPKNGKLDVGGAVGTDGEITVIKDLGLKEPYIGKCELVSGEIGIDYATYLAKSEGIMGAVAIGVLTDKDGCKASGGLIIEALPDADDNMIFMLEDILSNFTHISSMLAEKSIEEIVDFYFGHLDAQILDSEPLTLYCTCQDQVEGIIKSVGKAEAEDIIKEQGKIEIKCSFCSKTYQFTKQNIDEIFATDD